MAKSSRGSKLKELSKRLRDEQLLTMCCKMVMMLVSLLDLSLQSTFSGRGSCQEGSIIHMLTNRVTFNQSSASYGVVPQKVKFFSGKSTHRDREAWYEDLTIQLVVRCLFSLETSVVDSLWVHGQKILSFPELATLA